MLTNPKLPVLDGGQKSVLEIYTNPLKCQSCRPLLQHVSPSPQNIPAHVSRNQTNLQVLWSPWRADRGKTFIPPSMHQFPLLTNQTASRRAENHSTQHGRARLRDHAEEGAGHQAHALPFPPRFPEGSRRPNGKQKETQLQVSNLPDLVASLWSSKKGR